MLPQDLSIRCVEGLHRSYQFYGLELAAVSKFIVGGEQPEEWWGGHAPQGQQAQWEQAVKVALLFGRSWWRYPPRLSRVSSIGRCMQVRIGVSLRVYRLPSTSLRSMTRSRKSEGLSVSKATTNS